MRCARISFFLLFQVTASGKYSAMRNYPFFWSSLSSLSYLLLLLNALPALAATLEDFQVYAIRGIDYGDPIRSRGSDIQGRVGSGGDVRLRNVAIGQSLRSSESQSLIVRGTVQAQHVGIYNGGIESHSSIQIKNAFAGGDILSGDSVWAEQGKNAGIISSQRQSTLRQWQTRKTLQRPFLATTEHNDVIRQIRVWSSRLSLLEGKEFSQPSAGLLICEASATDKFTVCEASSSALDQTGEIILRGLPSQQFVLNFSGSTVYIGGKPGTKREIGLRIRFQDSRTGKEFVPSNAAQNYFWNFSEASHVFIDRVTFWGTLLAPSASLITTQHMRIVGRVFVGELHGNAQINQRYYEEPSDNIDRPKDKDKPKDKDDSSK
jgi:choice-of-anchor A domain-containing protein